MKKKIYSLGAAVYDHLINLESIPKKPIKVKGNEYTTRLGGPAAVASIFLSSHGVDSKFIGRLGDDDVSKLLIGELNKFKIKYKDSIIIKGAQSSQSYVYEDKDGERLLAAFNEKKLLNNKKLPKISFTFRLTSGSL